jgi:uncharacterized membrane protein YfbV (UPF0208 family)
MDYLAKWPATEGISPVFTERRIRTLGVKTKRPMPTMLVDGVSVAAAHQGSDDDVEETTACG